MTPMSSDPMTAPVGPAQETDKTPESAGEPESEGRDPVRGPPTRSQCPRLRLSYCLRKNCKRLLVIAAVHVWLAHVEGSCCELT